MSNTRGASSTPSRTFEDLYNKLVTLNKDLYYKSIIVANKDVLVRKTEEQIEDYFYQYKKNYISKNDMFTLIEGLRCKNHIIDEVVYKKITFARKTFCKPKPRKVKR
jgi:hypothetical protein